MMIDLTKHHAAARKVPVPVSQGRLDNVVGLVLEAVGCRASLGDVFEILGSEGRHAIPAEVVGLRGDRTLLMPLGPTHGLEVGAPLRRVGKSGHVPVGDALLGRVVDGLGRPLDGHPLPFLDGRRPLHGTPRNPLNRKPIETPVHVGVRAIDGLLTMGEGQRMGIFAGAGVGKSSLLGMLVRNAQLDVAVVALIGERGREVEDFVHRTLGEEGMRRSVVVAATSSDPPLVRARGAAYATAIAEHFRSRGQRVLLVMDSVTRLAMALREVGLATGEPPATKGYTPTVFAELPRLLERPGTSPGKGSITAVYTVLVEGDDLSDPIADAVRGILDGHIVLSRKLAERGHFPAIDIAASVSRIMGEVTTDERQRQSRVLRELIATHREAEDLISIGAYRAGVTPRLDAAVEAMPAIERFLRQAEYDQTSPAQCEAALRDLLKPRAEEKVK